jgi:hypothetical protein
VLEVPSEMQEDSCQIWNGTPGVKEA